LFKLNSADGSIVVASGCDDAVVVVVVVSVTVETVAAGDGSVTSIGVLVVAVDCSGASIMIEAVVVSTKAVVVLNKVVELVNSVATLEDSVKSGTFEMVCCGTKGVNSVVSMTNEDSVVFEAVVVVRFIWAISVAAVVFEVTTVEVETTEVVVVGSAIVVDRVDRISDDVVSVKS